ncbi:MAG TPA: pyridoxine 5'-phosphate synthase [Pyrinomonadaceae bacterium]|nr:pyridoxine 5'-phosphate synthase [Pyrinomonadaceae bacterium]
MRQRLNVNIDHVATVRQARRAFEPSVVAAAMICEMAGADGITIHLRADRRHIQDRDVTVLRDSVTTYLNVEMNTSDEMVNVALAARPDAVTFVAENPNEITTEGGLDVRASFDAVRAGVERLRAAGIIASLFVDPDAAQIEAAHAVGAQQVELCTALYAEHSMWPHSAHQDGRLRASIELRRLREAATLATQYGLRVAAGHGLTYRNVGDVAAIHEIEEFNIGHNIVARAVLTGLERAVREMQEAIRAKRSEEY